MRLRNSAPNPSSPLCELSIMGACSGMFHDAGGHTFNDVTVCRAYVALLSLDSNPPHLDRRERSSDGDRLGRYQYDGPFGDFSRLAEWFNNRSLEPVFPGFGSAKHSACNDERL
jgi:hypothetical protein